MFKKHKSICNTQFLD